MFPCTKLCFPENLCFLITPQNKQDAAACSSMQQRTGSGRRCTESVLPRDALSENSHKPPCMAKDSMVQGFYGGNDSNET